MQIFRAGNALFECNEVTGFGKIAGIMFRKKFKPLFFNFHRFDSFSNSIHSFFCVGFEAVFLDDKKKVVQILAVRPFSFIIPKACSYLIELPKGTVNKFKLKVGQVLNW